MGYESDMPGDIMFNIIPIVVVIGFVVIMGLFLFAIIEQVKQRRKDNASPVLSVDAKVVDKRQDVSRRARGDNMSSSCYTEYYVTFEVESGSRMELEVPNDQFGFIVIGDMGKLTFQGKRFLEFKR